MPFDGKLYQDDEILRVLRAAQKRIRRPENWCQGVLYLADQVCARGAILVALGMPTYSAYQKSYFGWGDQYDQTDAYLSRAAHEMGFFGSGELNNHSDHPTVMAMFERAQELRLAEIMEVAAV